MIGLSPAEKHLLITGDHPDTAFAIAKELKIEMWDGKKGKSIFKPEKTPSMIWFDEKNTFKCFATGRTYDIIDHFCKFHKKPFCDAVLMSAALTFRENK